MKITSCFVFTTLRIQRWDNPYGNPERFQKDGGSSNTKSGKAVLVTLRLPKMLNGTWGLFEWNIGYGGLEVKAIIKNLF